MFSFDHLSARDRYPQQGESDDCTIFVVASYARSQGSNVGDKLATRAIRDHQHTL